MSIEALHIRKTFGSSVVLDDVSVEAPSGKLIALLGPSGSGKTTLLRILAGLEFPDPGCGGRVVFHGQDVTHTPAGQRDVGFVFQHYALFRHMTVFENVAFGLRVRKRAVRPSRVAIGARVGELLGLVQLENFSQRYPHQLSGGQRQRVALARALAIDPKVLLLDEPFGALDAQVRKDLRKWLREFQQRIHVTTLLVTHDQEEALEIADEVVVMNQARVEQVGDPRTIYDAPATPFVCEFVGSVNRLGGAGDRPGHVYVRPHDIEILTTAAAGPIDGEALVRAIHAAGSVARVSLRQQSGVLLEAEIARHELDRLALEIGDTVRFRCRRSTSFGEPAVATSSIGPSLAVC
jgi:sulfate transport system ATP-binding protein